MSSYVLLILHYPNGINVSHNHRINVFALYFFVQHIKQTSNTRKVFKNNVYRYTKKHSMMTPAETNFFLTLNGAVTERYFVFPQVHLSAILNHKVTGQEWRYAFRHINGKSVDYVLCDKTTLKPTYAIELDDYTHTQKDRQTRDREVERIFACAEVPLVRFTNKNNSEADIINALKGALN